MCVCVTAGCQATEQLWWLLKRIHEAMADASHLKVSTADRELAKLSSMAGILTHWLCQYTERLEELESSQQ